MNTKTYIETMEELIAIRKELIEQCKNVDFKTFGYATDSNANKRNLLEILERASVIRNNLVEDIDMFPNGLTKISYELDWSSTQEQLIIEIDSLMNDIFQSYAERRNK